MDVMKAPKLVKDVAAPQGPAKISASRLADINAKRLAAEKAAKEARQAATLAHQRQLALELATVDALLDAGHGAEDGINSETGEIVPGAGRQPRRS